MTKKLNKNKEDFSGLENFPHEFTKPIKTFSTAEIKECIHVLGLPNFRAAQIIEGLYKHGYASFEEITNLPGPLQNILSKKAPLYFPVLYNKSESVDGSVKYLLQLNDGELCECVGLPDDNRLTVCVSTQVGCAMGCLFCATGQEGFTRNLAVGEIVDQVLFVQKDFGRPVTNVVFMGQGEPFLNFENVAEALNIINNSRLLHIGARKITVSTCGIAGGIDKFSCLPQQFTLAVSLHCAIQEVRDCLMPNVKAHSLSRLKQTLQKYIQKTNRRVSLEYVLLQGVNDSPVALSALQDFCKGLLCHVNLLPYNAQENSEFKPVSNNTLHQWQKELSGAGIETTIRTPRGADIFGACGMLKNKTPLT